MSDVRNYYPFESFFFSKLCFSIFQKGRFDHFALLLIKFIRDKISCEILSRSAELQNAFCRRIDENSIKKLVVETIKKIGFAKIGWIACAQFHGKFQFELFLGRMQVHFV